MAKINPEQRYRAARLYPRPIGRGFTRLFAKQLDFLSTGGKAAPGMVKVLALEANPDANLAGLDVSVVQAFISDNAGDVAFTGNMGVADVYVGDNSTLVATAAALNGVMVVGAAVVTGLDGAAAYDLSKLVGYDKATATLAANAVTTLNEETKLGRVEVTVLQNSELVLTAHQANGAVINGGDVDGTGNKGGSVTVVGLVDGVDLSSINASRVLPGAVNATRSDLVVAVNEDTDLSGGEAEEFGAFNIQVAEGATLTVDATRLGNGDDEPTTMTGAGNVTVILPEMTSNDSPINDDGEYSPGTKVDENDVDLSGIRVEGEKTALVNGLLDLSLNSINFANTTVKVAPSSTLLLSASQASDVVIEDASEDASGMVGIIFNESTDETVYDFSHITVGANHDVESFPAVVAIAVNEVVLHPDTDLGALGLIWLLDEEDDDGEVALTLSATQADGVYIGPALGNDDTLTSTVTVNDVAADTNLRFVYAETLVANVTESLDISANENLGTVDTFVVANGVVLTLSARQASASTVNVLNAQEEGATVGSAIIVGPIDAEEGDEADNDINFTSINKPFTFAGGELVIGEGVTVTLTAEQANGKTITGGGNVVVTDLTKDADLSGIAVTGTMTTTVTKDLVLDSAADLGDFAVSVGVDSESEAYTLTLTKEQAAALYTLKGEGAVVINGTVDGETLDFSSNSEWTIDTLTINGGGGADVLTAPANFAGAVTLNGGSNADTFNVASGNVTIGDFTPGVDELLIAAGATATITLAADTDLSETQTMARLAIEEGSEGGKGGTLNVDLNGFTLKAPMGLLNDETITTTGEGTIAVGGKLGVLTVKDAQKYSLADDAEYTITDDATAIQALIDEGDASAILNGATAITAQDDQGGAATLTLTVAQAKAFGKAVANGYTIVDTAEAIEAEAAADNTGVLASALEITAQTEAEPPVAETLTLTVAQANALGATLQGEYAIVDTAEAIEAEAATENAGVLASATAITAQTEAATPEAESLTLKVAHVIAFGSKVQGDYAVVDSVSNLTGEKGDLADATSVTVRLAANGNDAALFDVTLDSDVSKIDINGQAATLTVAQAKLMEDSSDGKTGTYSITDGLAEILAENESGHVEDDPNNTDDTTTSGSIGGSTLLIGATQMALGNLASGEAEVITLTGLGADHRGTAIDFSDNKATLSVNELSTIKDRFELTWTSDDAITITADFDENYNYLILTASQLKVASVVLDDIDDTATTSLNGAEAVHNDDKTSFDESDDVIIEIDGDENTLISLTAANIGGKSVIFDDSVDNAYTLTEAVYKQVFVTNGFKGAANDEITVTGLSGKTVTATDAKDRFKFLDTDTNITIKEFSTGAVGLDKLDFSEYFQKTAVTVPGFNDGVDVGSTNSKDITNYVALFNGNSLDAGNFGIDSEFSIKYAGTQNKDRAVVIGTSEGEASKIWYVEANSNDTPTIKLVGTVDGGLEYWQTYNVITD